MSAPQFTPGPWRFDEGMNAYGFQEEGAPILGTVRGAGDKPDGGEHIAVVVSDLAGADANARLIAAAPELYGAAAKHLEWIEKEKAGPDYGGLTRDTHPEGERIWGKWWSEQLDLCADTERLCRAALAKARGEQ